MTPKREMFLVIHKVLDEEIDTWGSVDGLADLVLSALIDAGFVTDVVRYRASLDATLQDEDGTWVDGVVSEEYDNRADAEARLERMTYGYEAVSEDKYLERRMLADWKRVR